jgi:hypothetical protein
MITEQISTDHLRRFYVPREASKRAHVGSGLHVNFAW